MTILQVRSEPFVRVTIPALLEHSLQLALDGVHAPFFVIHELGAIVAVLREDEWRRIGERFAPARVERGLHLVSLPPAGDGAGDVTSLAAALRAAGVRGTLVPSFHHDHVLVRAEDAARCAVALQRWLVRGGTGTQ